MQEEAQTYLDQGFTAFKMRFGYGPAHLQKGAYAKRILPKLEKFEPRWLQEPVIAGVVDRKAVSVVQYDMNRVGGITAAPRGR
ncbi:hypothetical protein D3C71_1558710 [compost metagenome]